MDNIPSFDTAKHFEAVKYNSRTEHSMAPEMLLMSKVVYDTRFCGALTATMMLVTCVPAFSLWLPGLFK